jgi:hypothetical protein
VNASLHRQLNRRKRRILRRLEHQPGVERPEPMMAASNIHYEIAERVRGLAPGGIGAIHLLAWKLGLIDDIDRDLHLLKRHQPSHESDHVLNIAYNLLAGGRRLEHIEVRRNDEVYLDALGAERIPDPTTAGDFCRRFAEADVERLMETFNETRLRAWKQQPTDFFDHAFIDADGALAPSDAWCKEGVDIAYDGTWGYHPLVVSLANTAEPLYLVNRSGNRPSHEHADVYLDKAAALCRRAGFRRITFRGDTKFTQTRHLDRGWPGQQVVRAAQPREASQGAPAKPDSTGSSRDLLSLRDPDNKLSGPPAVGQPCRPTASPTPADRHCSHALRDAGGRRPGQSFQLLLGRELEVDLVSLDSDREDLDLVRLPGQALPGLQREGLLVQRARDLGDAVLVADDPA